MSSMRALHFTLGPVQGFVSQARRTRDLLSGSFILSYLAGQAMWTVIEHGGSIDFPYVHEGKNLHDELLKAIDWVHKHPGQRLSDGPFIGSLPNRFQAKIPEEFSPKLCVQAVNDAWRNIAEVVWDEFMATPSQLGKDTRGIWDRQIDGFWDVAWVIGADVDLLDKRKNWRSYVPAVEPGDQCSLMGNRQELSGYVRSKPDRRKAQDKFWQAVREKCHDLDIQEGERLSAVALVKRLFPRVAERSIGWNLPVSYPSTMDFAVAHWLAEVLEDSVPRSMNSEKNVNAAARALSDYAYKLGVPRGEEYQRLPVVELASRRSPVGQLAYADPGIFYLPSLANSRHWADQTDSIRREVSGALKTLCELTGDKPHPFYAVLLMDGDSMGALLNDFPTHRDTVSRSLDVFTSKVNGLVSGHNGKTIYAGGDDVLALFPLEDAVEAAVALQLAYQDAFQTCSGIRPISEAFDQRSLGERGTISAAIIYAHHHVPFQPVIQQAHRLLDEVAKEQVGRNALAIQVWKPSGNTLIWAAPWEVVRYGHEYDEGTILEELVARFLDKEGARIGQYSSQFFYKIRDQFERVGGLFAEPTVDDQFVKLLTAEYLKTREYKDVSQAEATERVARLVYICREWRRDKRTGVPIAGKLNASGALVVRFLGQKGGEAQE